MEKQYNYFYKIENTLNGKFYYGVHATDNLDDGYLGSGKRIGYAVKKYGKENFKKENLIFFETFSQALDYEAEIVNEVLLLDPSCYNLKCGGKGGNNGMGDGWYSENGRKVLTKAWQDPIIRKAKIESLKNSVILAHKRGVYTYGQTFKGKHHTEETKKLIGSINKIKQSGSGNSQYGKCWITNEVENKSIYRGDNIPSGWKLGRKMNKK